MIFYKYQGTGNDFVMIDQRQHHYLSKENTTEIRQLCDRRFGIGADGLILLQNHPDYDFEMVYFNSDGKESSMCGNGGRCLVAFAHYLGIFQKECRFLAIDGEHEATINEKGDWVELKMANVSNIEVDPDFYYMDTGSPHYVQFVENIEAVDVFAEGRAIRYSPRFSEVGTNVNFVEPTATGIKVLTYERGVEDETLSCGTGVTAAAIAHYLRTPLTAGNQIDIQAKGGKLQVRFEPSEDSFQQVWLCGKAIRVFQGEVDLGNLTL